MKPLTNSQIAAMKTREQKDAERGRKAQVSLSRNLLRSYVLVQGTGRDSNLAELRDSARNGLAVFSGTVEETVARARVIGVWVE